MQNIEQIERVIQEATQSLATKVDLGRLDQRLIREVDRLDSRLYALDDRLTKEVDRLDKRIERVVAAAEDRLTGKMAEMESRIMHHMDTRFDELAMLIARALPVADGS